MSDFSTAKRLLFYILPFGRKIVFFSFFFFSIFCIVVQVLFSPFSHHHFLPPHSPTPSTLNPTCFWLWPWVLYPCSLMTLPFISPTILSPLSYGYSGEHYAKWNKPGGERQIPYDLTYKWNLINKTNKEAKYNQRKKVVDGSPHLGVRSYALPLWAWSIYISYLKFLCTDLSSLPYLFIYSIIYNWLFHTLAYNILLWFFFNLSCFLLKWF